VPLVVSRPLDVPVVPHTVVSVKAPGSNKDAKCSAFLKQFGCDPGAEVPPTIKRGNYSFPSIEGDQQEDALRP
jgi:hypothetical protein